ncbi:WD-40 repeat protein [Lunatimonas lonarensis]|uniref:WD-40 repeat protein n=1 Tax=Lunatimonas lonarensis TaxID=1232681 RepID=R7ZT30_9BACT|nr:PQQ-binding-like beta-propeller repeat protein [Lunatimonas lonarensis]EON77306.1 WD-40 repeat protein [Lunatimonas lonarensis]
MSKITVNKLHTLSGHNDSIYALTEGVNPRFFYTGDGDGYVVEWDLDQPKDGKLVAKLPNSVYALAVEKASKLLVIGHNFEGIHVIDLVDKKEIWSLKLTSHPIFDLQFADGLLYVATGDGVLIVVDMDERSPRKHIKLSSAALRSLAVNPINGHLAVGSSDHSITVLERGTHHPLAKLEKHTNSVFALGYTPDGNTLISGGRDAHLHTWNSADYSLKNTIVAHMYAINYLSFRDDGRYFVTCSMDKSIKLWDAESYQLLKVIDKGRHAGHGTSINKLFWSSYNRQVVAVSDDRTASIWNIEF